MFEGATASVFAGGHTHVPLTRRHGGNGIVNPGSVGMPFTEYGYAGGVRVMGYAEYAIVAVDGIRLGIEHRQVHVDADLLVASVERSRMPQANWWLGLRSGGLSTEI